MFSIHEKQGETITTQLQRFYPLDWGQDLLTVLPKKS